MSIIASSYMQIFLSFYFSEIATVEYRKKYPCFKTNLTVSRLMASINSGLPYIYKSKSRKVFTAGKVVSQEQLRISLRA